jgi:hypothetical protein
MNGSCGKMIKRWLEWRRLWRSKNRVLVEERKMCHDLQVGLMREWCEYGIIDRICEAMSFGIPGIRVWVSLI